MDLDRWKKLTEWPLTLLAVAFLVAYAVEVIGDLRGTAATPWEAVLNVVWALFAVEYIVSLILAPQRGRWFFRHLPDFFMVALPFLRPLRLLRLVTLVQVLQRRAGTAFRGKVTTYVIVAGSLLVFIASLAVLDAEQNVAGSKIRNFGDALWWAFETITTVGYGDYYPITFVGRLVAVGLMIAGIAMIGTVTAAFASWFIERVAAENEEATQVLRGNDEKPPHRTSEDAR